ncbi:hypothetical protein TWF694_009497 [Orbilia ellipsospora]|uniref:Nudix hydrolase domain-containing protein n=1 Tax=Orbilia ellipsospora TaxID=2528407 RepID=A0AAV9XC54_9PEZI
MHTVLSIFIRSHLHKSNISSSISRFSVILNRKRPSHTTNARMSFLKIDTHSYVSKLPFVATPRPSASLILLDSQNRILLTHRTSTIGSFANAHVFPGGNQDPEDTSPEFCAIRETFEETGVLLTIPPPPSSLFSTFPQVRKQIHSHEIKFSDFLKANNLSANVESLIPYTTWITPPTMKKRYETRMFLTFLPLSTSSSEGIEETMNLPTSDGGAETVSAKFMTAEEILADARENKIILFPPQAYLVTRLLKFVTDGSLSVVQQREAIKEWIEAEGMGRYVFEPRPEGKTKDGKRLILGYGPRGDPNRKSVFKPGKSGMPEGHEIVEATQAAKL